MEYGYDTHPTNESVTAVYNETATYPFDRISLAKRLLAQPHNIAGLTLSTLAIILNIFSLLALSHVRGRTAAHFQLIKSLACSDIIISLIMMVHGINRAFNPVLSLYTGTDEERRLSLCMHMVIKAVYASSLNITLLNLLLMAIDHYLAIMRPLFHPRILSSSRTRTLIAVIWILSSILGFSDFYVELHNVPKIQRMFDVNFCEAIYITRYQDEYGVFALTTLIYPIMLVLYIRLCTFIRRLTFPGQRDQINSKCCLTVRQDVIQKRNKKALVTTLLILGTFSICWLPNYFFQSAMCIYAEMTWPNPPRPEIFSVLQQFDKVFVILLLMNCCVDPIIYSFRFREIRLGYQRLLHCDKMDNHRFRATST